MVNFLFDDKTKSWHNEFGFERYFTGENLYLIGGTGPYPKNGPVWGVYCWASHNGAKQSLLFEQENEIYEVNGSKKEAELVQGGRKPPAVGDYLTTYEPHGNYVVIANGNNSIVKYRGKNKLFPVGWPEAPGPVSPRNPASDPSARKGGYFYFSSEDYMSPEVAGLGSPQSENWPGVGSKDKDHVNEYFYKVSYINENGSESPISQQSDKVIWTTTEFAKDGVNVTSRTGVLITGIPSGPEGTVARKIYRTKNNSASAFFFAAMIYDNVTEDFVDYLEDDQLGDLAPDPSTSIVMPSQAPRFAASFNNCLFIDGGKNQPSTLYYSNALQMDSFGATNYFDVGNRQGGDVTGLYSYYNNLFVFRERAIDVITGTPGNFQITPFIEGVGCKSHSTIQAVPGVGIVFLSEDGIYAIQGNFSGYELKLTKLSTGMDFIIEGMSRSGAARAIAQYWPQQKEYQCFIPWEGDNQVQLGLVLHQNGGWSLRDGWPIACATVDYDGNFIFGHKKGNANQYNAEEIGENVGNGLYVISSTRQMGTVVGPDGAEKKIDPGPAPTSTFRSQWHDFGYGPQKKQVKYIYLYAYTYGQQQIGIQYFRDGSWHSEDVQYNYSGTIDATDVQEQNFTMSIPDHPDQPNYVTGPSTATYGAIWDSSKWQDNRPTEIRISIPIKLASSFAFQVETNNRFNIVGYSIEFTSTPTQTGRGKGLGPGGS